MLGRWSEKKKCKEIMFDTLRMNASREKQKKKKEKKKNVGSGM
jgi:hypothetical protein